MPSVAAEYALAIQPMSFRSSQGIMRAWRKNSSQDMSR